MRIIQVMRAPVGGLFRHVRDLSRGLSQMGHDVGVVCDTGTGGDYATQLLKELKPFCSLGIERRAIPRAPGWGDLVGVKAVYDVAKSWNADVLHGHGAKGGVYARTAGLLLNKKSFYTPHGGTLHHVSSGLSGHLFTAMEKVMRRAGTGLCFVCEYEKQKFDAVIGIRRKPYVVAYNGLWEEEFKPVVAADDAADFLFVGEMRDLKGVDILIRALALVPNATLNLVGDGPSLQNYQALANNLGLSHRTKFLGRLPFSTAASLGRIMVLPSRHESFPYIVLETASAGLPMIASAVGGIPEVVPRALLCDPLTPQELARRMTGLLQNPELTQQQSAAYSAHIRNTCSAARMAEKIAGHYKAPR